MRKPNPSKRLTPRDDIALLRYIKAYTSVHRVPPTVREIRDEFNLNSTSPAAWRISRLLDQGYVERVPEISRGLFVTNLGHKALKQHERAIDKATYEFKAIQEVS